METWKESSLLILNIQSLWPEHSRKEGTRVSENDMCAAKKKQKVDYLMKLCNGFGGSGVEALYSNLRICIRKYLEM